MRRIITILAVLLLSFSGAAAACAHQAPVLAMVGHHDAAHHADCPSNSAADDMQVAAADALCDCAQPAFVDTISKPLPMVLASAHIVWSGPPSVYLGAGFAQIQFLHGPSRLYLLTGRLRL